MRACVDSVCTHAEWPIGHVYLVAEDCADELVPTTHWHMVDTTRYDALRTLTERARLTRGQGLPGMALASGRPETSAAVSEIAGCPRAQCLRQIGVRSGFAFPVYVGANIVAVLEFYSDKLLAPNDSVTRFAAPLAALLGRAVAHERAQASLRESEERYRKLVDLSPDAIYVQKSGRIVLVNAAGLKVFGATSADQIIGKSPLDLVHPVDRAEIADRMKVYAKEGTYSSFAAEQRRLRVDGTEFLAEVEGEVVGESGTIVKPAIKAVAAREGVINEGWNAVTKGKTLTGGGGDERIRFKSKWFAGVGIA